MTKKFQEIVLKQALGEDFHWKSSPAEFKHVGNQVFVFIGDVKCFYFSREIWDKVQEGTVQLEWEGKFIQKYFIGLKERTSMISPTEALQMAKEVNEEKARIAAKKRDAEEVRRAKEEEQLTNVLFPEFMHFVENQIIGASGEGKERVDVWCQHHNWQGEFLVDLARKTLGENGYKAYKTFNHVDEYRGIGDDAYASMRTMHTD